MPVSPFVEVADRVFVARYPQWDVSVGFVVGRAGALVVDTRASTGQGREITEDVRLLGFGAAATTVVNTHVHFDHTFGNAAFTGAGIHAHDNVARHLEAASAPIKGLIREDMADAPEYGYTTADLLDVLATKVRGPDHTSAAAATIDLGDRVVELRHCGRGHTDGDIAIHVPDAAVTFLGDLVEESAAPSLGADAWPIDWPATLDAHANGLSACAVVVPGHGTRVDAAFVRRQRDEPTLVADVVRERHAAGIPLDAAQQEPDSRLPYPLDQLADAFTRGYAQLDDP